MSKKRKKKQPAPVDWYTPGWGKGGRNVVVANFLERPSDSTLMRESAKCLNDGNKIDVAITVGFIKAVMECPDCPGVFRIPIDKGGGIERIGCSNCFMVWRYTP